MEKTTIFLFALLALLGAAFALSPPSFPTVFYGVVSANGGSVEGMSLVATINGSRASATIVPTSLYKCGEEQCNYYVTVSRAENDFTSSEIEFSINGRALEQRGSFLAGKIVRLDLVSPVAAQRVEEDGEVIEVPADGADISIEIPNGVENAVLDVSAISALENGSRVAAVNNSISAYLHTDLGGVLLGIPAGTRIYGSEAWNGRLGLPMLRANAEITPPANAGFIATSRAIVEVGLENQGLTFSRGVQLVLPRMAGKSAGYVRNGAFAPITQACESNTQAAGDALAEGGSCKIDFGTDMVIWTKHFTKFVAYTQTQTNVGNQGGSGSGSQGGGGAGSGGGSAGGNSGGNSGQGSSQIIVPAAPATTPQENAQQPENPQGNAPALTQGSSAPGAEQQAGLEKSAQTAQELSANVPGQGQSFFANALNFMGQKGNEPIVISSIVGLLAIGIGIGLVVAIAAFLFLQKRK